MGLLRSVVDTVIGNMSPEERVEAIHEVSAQAIELMTPDERRDLTHRILTDLLASLTGAERQALATQLSAPPLSVTQE
jgi:Mg/Co/Ni transporter MgtE